MEHWQKTVSGNQLTYTHVSGAFVVVQQAGVRGREGTQVTDNRVNGKPVISQAAYSELVADIKTYDAD